MGGASSKQSKNRNISAIQPSPSTQSIPVSISPPTPQQSNLPPTSVTVTPLNISVDTNRANQSCGGGLNKNFSSEMLITPGREESMYSKVAYTPQVINNILSLNFFAVF